MHSFQINYLTTISISVLIITFNTIAISQEINTDIRDRKNYTANDLILELAKLASGEGIPRQRIPPNQLGINPNYQYPGYYDDYQQNQQGYDPQNNLIYAQQYQRPLQYPFNRRPTKQRPYRYRPDYYYRPQGSYQQNDQYQGIDPNLQGQYPAIDPNLQAQYPAIDPNLQGQLPGYDDPFYGFTKALGSIARYDDRQCVPRLLCEVAAGTNPGAKQSSFLPSFLSMDSLFTLLSAFTSDQVSPYLIFGRAALLGVTSQGNPSSCRYAYPECPRDPDRLVEYLNNHNGGFFRFFGGLQQQEQQQLLDAANYQQNYQDNYYTRPQQQSQRPVFPNRYQYRSPNNNTDDVQAKIQNKPIFAQGTRPNDLYIAQSFYYPNVLKENSAVRFPEASKSNYEPNTLKFPADSFQNEKRPKTLFFSGQSNVEQNDIFLPTPLPYYDHSKMIFPDRTGTGNLVLDSQKYYPNVPNYYSSNPVYNNGGSSVKYHDNQYQSSQKKYVYIVRGNGDPNHPEIVSLTGRQSKAIEEEQVDNDNDNRREGKPWLFPNAYQGKIYNDRSIDIQK